MLTVKGTVQWFVKSGPWLKPYGSGTKTCCVALPANMLQTFQLVLTVPPLGIVTRVWQIQESYTKSFQGCMLWSCVHTSEEWTNMTYCLFIHHLVVTSNGMWYIVIVVYDGLFFQIHVLKPFGEMTTRWWFQRFFIFTFIWGRFPFSFIFFKWVETTN